MDNQSYAAAIECLERIDEAVGLSEYGLYSLCCCYSLNDQNNQCIQACNRWIAEFENSDEDNRKRFIYWFLADSYYYGMEDYSKALLWNQKQMNCWDDEKNIMRIKKSIAFCYQKLNQPYKAKELYHEYMEYTIIKLAKELGYSTKELADRIKDGKIKNKELGSDLFGYALILYDCGEGINADGCAIKASLLGNSLAQQYCINTGLRYTYSSVVNWNW